MNRHFPSTWQWTESLPSAVIVHAAAASPRHGVQVGHGRASGMTPWQQGHGGTDLHSEELATVTAAASHRSVYVWPSRATPRLTTHGAPIRTRARGSAGCTTCSVNADVECACGGKDSLPGGVVPPHAAITKHHSWRGSVRPHPNGHPARPQSCERGVHNDVEEPPAQARNAEVDPRAGPRRSPLAAHTGHYGRQAQSCVQRRGVTAGPGRVADALSVCGRRLALREAAENPGRPGSTGKDRPACWDEDGQRRAAQEYQLGPQRRWGENKGGAMFYSIPLHSQCPSPTRQSCYCRCHCCDCRCPSCPHPSCPRPSCPSPQTSTSPSAAGAHVLAHDAPRCCSSGYAASTWQHQWRQPTGTN